MVETTRYMYAQNKNVFFYEIDVMFFQFVYKMWNSFNIYVLGLLCFGVLWILQNFCYVKYATGSDFPNQTYKVANIWCNDDIVTSRSQAA